MHCTKARTYVWTEEPTKPSLPQGPSLHRPDPNKVSRIAIKNHNNTSRGYFERLLWEVTWIFREIISSSFPCKSCSLHDHKTRDYSSPELYQTIAIYAARIYQLFTLIRIQGHCSYHHWVSLVSRHNKVYVNSTYQLINPQQDLEQLFWIFISTEYRT